MYVVVGRPEVSTVIVVCYVVVVYVDVMRKGTYTDTGDVVSLYVVSVYTRVPRIAKYDAGATVVCYIVSVYACVI